jgi:hypothetical protein
VTQMRATYDAQTGKKMHDRNERKDDNKVTVEHIGSLEHLSSVIGKIWVHERTFCGDATSIVI